MLYACMKRHYGLVSIVKKKKVKSTNFRWGRDSKP